MKFIRLFKLISSVVNNLLSWITVCKDGNKQLHYILQTDETEIHDEKIIFFKLWGVDNVIIFPPMCSSSCL